MGFVRIGVHAAHRDAGEMDLKQLQLLVDLVDAGSLSKVCAMRGIAQSALSKQIAGLEKDFAARLFYRTGRGVVLTEFGQALLPRVKSVLAEAELLKQEIRARAGVPSGPVRLAMQASITQYMVGALFHRVRQDFPLIELRLMEGFSGSIEEWLANGRADVGVLARYGSHSNRTDEALNTDDMYLIGPAGDKLTARRSFNFAELAGVPLVLPGIPDGLRLMLAETARKHGVTLRVEVEVDSLTAMKEIVAGGSGYTILTQQAVLTELETARLQSALIVEPGLSRTLVLSTSAHQPLTSASRAVVALIRKLADDTERVDRWRRENAPDVPHSPVDTGTAGTPDAPAATETAQSKPAGTPAPSAPRPRTRSGAGTRARGDQVRPTPGRGGTFGS